MNALSQMYFVRLALKRNSKATPLKIKAITINMIGKYKADRTAE